jgi:hypothetical protein
MPMQRGKGSTAKVVELARTEEVPEVPNDVAASPLYGVAMLKIAMELKKAPEASLDALITGVLQKMKLPEEDFRGFLAANGGLLRTIAMKRRY